MCSSSSNAESIEDVGIPITNPAGYEATKEATSKVIEQKKSADDLAASEDQLKSAQAQAQKEANDKVLAKRMELVKKKRQQMYGGQTYSLNRTSTTGVNKTSLTGVYLG